MADRERRVTAGVAVVALAFLGWAATLAVVPFLQRPGDFEDLTAAWTQAGPTALGEHATVTVPPGQTLVAFLVGTGLGGLPGTTGGSCTAARGNAPVDLVWPVQIDPSLTGVLDDGQEIVAIAGWNNTTGQPATVTIRCTTADSGVEHYVAVPSRTAVLTDYPWFQPWGWVGLALAGVALIISGAERVKPPTR